MPRRNAGAAGDSTPPTQDAAAGAGGGAPTRRKRPPIRTNLSVPKEEAAGKGTPQPVSEEQVVKSQPEVAPSPQPVAKKPAPKPKASSNDEPKEQAQPVAQDSPVEAQEGSELPTGTPGREKPAPRTRGKAVGKSKIKAPVRQKKERGPKPTYDWDTAFREFTEGILRSSDSSDEDRWFPNLRELAERHDLNYTTLREKASKERWTDQKNAYQLEVTRERQKKRAQKMAKSAVEFDEKALKVGELGTNLIMWRLGEIIAEAQARKDNRDDAIARLKAGQIVEREELHSAIYSREMESLAAAAERFQNIAMRAIGTDIQKYSITGADGEGVGGNTIINITREITRDDPERVAALIKSFGDAGLLPQEVKDAVYEIQGVIDAEVIEDAPAPQLPAGVLGEDVEADDDDMTPEEVVKSGETE